MNKYYLVTISGADAKLAMEAPDDDAYRASLIDTAITEGGLSPSESASFEIGPLDRPSEQQLAVKPDFSREGCKFWIVGSI